MTTLSDRTLAHLKEVIDCPDLSGTRYELLHEEGRGGMGVVYAVRDRELRRTVALKVLATAVADEESAERLKREARIIAGLEHPGIVPVHDVGVLPDGRLFYAMKRVGGQRLDAYAGTKHPLAERLRLFVRICEPVAFAHAHGVIHRDLKPENVMVGPFGEVLVMDWGVAKELGAAEPGGAPAPLAPPDPSTPSSRGGTAHGTVIGTRAWMPPEQAKGEVARLDARTDVYALGAILHFLLTGHAPGAAPDEDLASTRTWAGYAGPKPEHSVPPRRLGHGVPRPLEAICRKALSETPEARYANAAELGADIGLFLEGSAVQAFPEGPWRRGLRFASRHKTAIVLVVAYLVVRAVMMLVLHV